MRTSKTVVVCLGLALPLVAAAQIYQWTDAAGTVHFDGSPPTNQAYKEVNIHSTPASGSGNAGVSKAAHDYDAAREQADKMDVAQKAEAAHRAEACAKARDRVSTLENTPPHRFMTMGANGEPARMTDDEYNKELETSRGAVRANCS